MGGMTLEAARQAAAAQTDEAAATEAKVSALAPRRYQFTVDYVTPSGKSLNATLQNDILKGEQRMLVSKMASIMCGSLPWETVPHNTRERAVAIAWLDTSLVNPPKWVMEYAQEDDILLMELYTEVVRHEALYFRPDVPAGDAGEEIPRVRVHSTLDP